MLLIERKKEHFIYLVGFSTQKQKLDLIRIGNPEFFQTNVTFKISSSKKNPLD